MTPHQFWHEDEKLLIAYSKAYNRNVYVNAHIQGAYVFEAVSIALNNAFADKKSKMQNYPQKVFDPYLEENKKMTKVQVEEKYREKTAFWANLGK